LKQLKEEIARAVKAGVMTADPVRGVQMRRT
jgi:hypothetical protein